MRVSIFTTVGNEKTSPYDRGDCFNESISSYCDLADEVVVVDGSKTLRSPDLPSKVTLVYREWPWDFCWSELPRAMNTGYEMCSGDWVIRADIDYIFHEEDISQIRYILENSSSYPVTTFQKFCFVTKDGFYEKGGLPIAINKGLVGDSYGFGQATNTDTDLCYPIRITGKNKKGIPQGEYEPEKFGKTGLPVYNYDYSGKTKGQTKDEFWRFSKAYHEYFGGWKFGDSREAAFDVFMDMMMGRLKKCVYEIGKEKQGQILTHPKYVKDWIDNLNPDQFAYNMWGHAK